MQNELEQKLISLLEQIGDGIEPEFTYKDNSPYPICITIKWFTETFGSDEWEYQEIVSLMNKNGYNRLKNNNDFLLT